MSVQTVWWIQRAEQRFLFGYSWTLLSDEQEVRVRRLTMTLAPDSSVRACVYGDPKHPESGVGSFDGKKFMMHFQSSDVEHWAQLQRATALDKQLPGCIVSIEELQRLYPASNETTRRSLAAVAGPLWWCTTGSWQEAKSCDACTSQSPRGGGEEASEVRSVA